MERENVAVKFNETRLSPTEEKFMITITIENHSQVLKCVRQYFSQRLD